MDMAITVVNKGSPILDPLPARATVISTANVPHARETGSYCFWLSQRYHSLPEHVYFTQARFDDHAPAFLVRLNEPPRDCYRGLTRRYNDVIPPPGLLPHDPSEERDEWFNAWTLDFLQFVDVPAPMYLKNLQAANGWPPGTNSVTAWLKLLGVKDSHLPGDPNIARFTYGATFSVPRHLILQHSKSVYERLGEEVCRDWTFGYVAERCWRVLLEGASAVESTFSPSKRGLSTSWAEQSKSCCGDERSTFD